MHALSTRIAAIPRGLVVASASGAATGLVLARRVIAARRAEEAAVLREPMSMSSQSASRRLTVASAGGGAGESVGGATRQRGEFDTNPTRPRGPHPHIHTRAPLTRHTPFLLSPVSAPTTTATLMVDGMVCSKCTARVEKALIDAGMELAKADLATGVVSVTGPGADAASLAAVVTGIGFPAVPAGE